MPLEEKTLKFLSLYKSDVDKMKGTHDALIAGHDRANFDPRTMRVAYSRRGSALIEFAAELIGSYSNDDEIYRWGWANRKNGADAQKIDAIYKEGQNYHIDQLTERSISRPGETGASRLADTSAAVAKAHGVFVAEEGRRFHFYALYTDPKNLIGVSPRAKLGMTQAMPSQQFAAPTGVMAKPPPAPGVAKKSMAPPPVPSQARMAATVPQPPPMRQHRGSLPPTPMSVVPMPMPAPLPSMGQTQAMQAMSPAQLQQHAMQMAQMQQQLQLQQLQMQQLAGQHLAPTQAMPMMAPLPMVQASSQTLDPERARLRFTPCAEIAIRFIMGEVPDFKQAVLLIASITRDPRLYFPVLVVIDGEGNLRSLEPTPPTLEACQQYVMNEYQAGALFWARFEARISKKPTGGIAITIHTA